MNLRRRRVHLRHHLKATYTYMPVYPLVIVSGWLYFEGRKKGNLRIKTGINKCYTDTSQQNAENITKKRYENVAESEHLTTTLTNRNHTPEKLRAMLPLRAPDVGESHHICVYSSRTGRVNLFEPTGEAPDGRNYLRDG